ncbi:hypothetical protein COCOBI_15-1280 [Coccomyxa sp. Obi]|nr:hypothetical protein COCOBI_15-1280 [Coccomyxa sp. Obi]
MGTGTRRQWKVMREALKMADDDGDDGSSICLRWIMCHAILPGAEGPTFQVSEVLSSIDKARAAMDEAESWTHPMAFILPHNYWPCLGVAARYKATIRKEPSFAQRRMRAYASPADLDSEKRHVKCCPSYKWCLHL